MARKSYIGAFDTEDDSMGNVTFFAFVHETGIYTTKSRSDALDFVVQMARDCRKKKTRLEIWATNLEYDIINLFGIERISETKLIFGKSYLVGAEWTGQNVIFRDTFRHLPVSVKTLGDLVGLKKLEENLFNRKKKPTAKQIKTRCIRDATITFRTAKFLYYFYGELGITPRMTLASCALKIWKENYWKQDVFFPDNEIVDNARNSYYGGRTEAFAIGEFTDIRVIDAASMFPWAMICDKMPLPWGTYAREKEIQRFGIYHARISYHGENPCLPYRTQAGLCYPIGKFSGWYTSEELRYAISIGYSVKVTEGYTFLEDCRPFDKYVNDLFIRKNAARDSRRLGYKLLLNSLYGKFAQTGERIETMSLEDFANLKNQPEDFSVWNGIVIYKVNESPPPWGNCVWPAFVTARARIKLHKEMMKIKNSGGLSIYCDTDGVFFTGAKKIRYPKRAENPGSFELRGEFPRIIIAGKKEYGLQDKETKKWEWHAKGVPFAARESYLLFGTASFERPTRIKESMRHDIAANVWLPKTKQRRISYDSRGRLSSGLLAPITINE